ncbi:Oidioi.mRNA.OKI2018_I69.XSR.g13547.t1.cds [Oikopleura dioica]|uniref:Hexosyltransferase n=1 Tax=Oikopleura dioica TaxID=34765 RepID=A0ABN7S8W8_OIKDI|nr:Oidioi.mRNA.OKI2018_I69.XSR.g13547.t1.cds [Oikopleura dioica]
MRKRKFNRRYFPHILLGSFFLSCFVVLNYDYVSSFEKQNYYQIVDGECTAEFMPTTWRSNFLAGKKWHVGHLKIPSCPKGETRLTVIIKTAISNHESRDILRNYYLKVKRKLREENGIELSHFFVVGYREDSTVENADDIIIGNFEDTYANLPYKTKAAYEYFTLCENKEENQNEQSTLIIHDDDTWVNVVEIVKFFELGKSGLPYNELYGNHRLEVSVENYWMDEKGFDINEEIWPYSFWPNYISGPCVIMSSVAAKKISSSASEFDIIPQIPVEDAVYTGILRVKNCLKLGRLGWLYNNHQKYCVHTENQIEKLQAKIDKTLSSLNLL